MTARGQYVQAEPVTATPGPDPVSAFAYPSCRPANPVFGKVLVAERGDLAARMRRRLEKLGIATAARYTDEDEDAGRIVEAAVLSGAEAIHPGYGPLAESADLARACDAAGLGFIGPSAITIETINSRRTARALVLAAGIPVLPATAIPMHSPTARHVEVEILADGHGNVVHLGERACSIRHDGEALIDESPAPGLDPQTREGLLRFGVAAARAIGYRSAGTVAGVIAGDEFHFVEMYPPGQVAHRMSEMLTGLDLLREQLAIAAGCPLSFTQADVWVRGHAIECHINAQDASNGFARAVGEITRYREPVGSFVHVDSGVQGGSRVLLDTDPTIATLIVWDRDREAATRRMLRALDDYEIEGPQTLLPFHRALLGTPEWASADTCQDLNAVEAGFTVRTP